MLLSFPPIPAPSSRGDLDLPCDHAHHVAVPARLRQGARKHHLAALQNIDAVDVVGNMVHVGFRDQNALPHRADGGDTLGDQRNDRGRQPLERLIEQQQFWIKRQRAGDRYHLALAAGKLAAAAPEILPQLWEHRVGFLNANAGRTARWPRPGRKLKILGHRQVGVDFGYLWREADAALRDLPGRQLGQVGTVEADAAGPGAAIAYDAAKGRCLAGSVAPDQADQFSRAHRQADTVEDTAALDVDFQVRQIKHHGVLLNVCGRVPTTAAIMAGSLKKASGGMSASTLPSCSATMRCEYRSTRSMSCSTWTMPRTPAAFAAETSTSMIACLSAVETPLVGSSSRITDGLRAKALAISSNFFSPWDNVEATVSSRARRPRTSAMRSASAGSTLSRLSERNGLATRRKRDATATASVSRTVSAGKMLTS